MDNFGEKFRLASHWFNILSVDNYSNKPINYLEIGSYYGSNIISVANSYGLHEESKLFCIERGASRFALSSNCYPYILKQSY